MTDTTEATGFSLLEYQWKAVNEIVDKVGSFEKTLQDLRNGDESFQAIAQEKYGKRFLLSSPTGSGKTVMAAAIVDALINPDSIKGLRDTVAQTLKSQRFVFFFVAPNQLHKQSFDGFVTYREKIAGDPNRALANPVNASTELPSKLQQNDVYFLNWASANKDKNIINRDTERQDSLASKVVAAQAARLTVVFIVDEAHNSYGKKGAESLKDNLNPEFQILLTATPDGLRDFIEKDGETVVPRKEVIEENIIVKSTIFNEFGETNPLSEVPSARRQILEGDPNSLYVAHALRKRNDMHLRYKKAASKVNPLVGIQLSSDAEVKYDVANEKKATSSDRTNLSTVLATLKALDPELTVENGTVAVWLADDKRNLEDIQSNDSKVKVIVFKYAVALGWDCPRMKVMVLERDNQSKAFSIQTVGRAIRKPEHVDYEDDTLNHAYAYTPFDKIEDLIKDASDDEVEVSLGSLSLRDEFKFLTDGTVPSIRNWFNVRSNQANATVDKARKVWQEELFGGETPAKFAQYRKNPKEFFKAAFGDWAKGKVVSLVIAGEVTDTDASQSKLSHVEVEDNAARVEHLFRQSLKKNVLTTNVLGQELVITQLLSSALAGARKTQGGRRFSDIAFKSQFLLSSTALENLAKAWRKTTEKICEADGVDPNHVKTPKPTANWTIPATQEVAVSIDSRNSIDSDSKTAKFSIYQTTDADGEKVPAAWARSDSNNEKFFYEKAIPAIVEELKRNPDGTQNESILVGFARNGVNNRTYLGVPYGKRENGDYDRVTYPDWFFFRKDGDKVDIFIIETKKEGLGRDANTPLKNKALHAYAEHCNATEFASSNIRLHATVLNYETGVTQDQYDKIGFKNTVFPLVEDGGGYDLREWLRIELGSTQEEK